MKKYKNYMNVGTGLWSLDKGDGMTELNLLDALVEKLTDLFRNEELTGKSGLLQPVRVFAQYLPQPKPAEVTVDDDDDTESETESTETITPEGYSPEDIESLFPCVIVKLDEATDKEEGSLDQTRIKVVFLVGTYDESPDCQGYRDVLNIIETIRQELLSMPGRVLAKRYRLEMPLKNYLFDEQAWPVYFGVVESSWETGRPLMREPRGGDYLCPKRL